MRASESHSAIFTAKPLALFFFGANDGNGTPFAIALSQIRGIGGKREHKRVLRSARKTRGHDGQTFIAEITSCKLAKLNVLAVKSDYIC